MAAKKNRIPPNCFVIHKISSYVCSLCGDNKSLAVVQQGESCESYYCKDCLYDLIEMLDTW